MHTCTIHIPTNQPPNQPAFIAVDLVFPSPITASLHVSCFIYLLFFPSFCNVFSSPDFARSGFLATQTVVISAGPLSQFSHALQPHLQQLGMPTVLKRGIITLENDFTVCKRGKALTPEQARILKLFGHAMAEFRIHLKAVWTQADGQYEEIESGQSNGEQYTKVVIASDSATAPMEGDDSMLTGQLNDDDDADEAMSDGGSDGGSD